MKKKIFSILGILILGLNTVFCNAVEISFSNLDSQNGEFYIDDEEYFKEAQNISDTENLLEDEDSYIDYSHIFENSSLEATNENIFSEPRINLLNSENENLVENLFIPENLNYTIVDITDLATGEIITHDCNLYLISNFDETNHWNECSICGKIVNKETHNFEDAGWTGGSASNCEPNNVHLFTCVCGMNYSNVDGRAEHKLGSYVNDTGLYRYYQQCTVCRNTNNATHHYCQKADGSRINCSNIGRCSLCGYNYTSVTHRADVGAIGDGNVCCDICGKQLGIINYWNTSNPADGQFKFETSISIPSGYSSISYEINNMLNAFSSKTDSKETLKISTVVRYNSHIEYGSSLVHGYIPIISGQRCYIYLWGALLPESTPPVITNINSNTGEWTTDSTISIKGTENYCNSVNLTLKDTNDNIYAENVIVPVNNKNWSYEIKPNLESQENTEFILEVSDPLNNTTKQSFYLSKIDSIPPKAIETETLNTSWSKTKDYIFTSSDYGIGQVQNSAINTDNYELATENENIFYKGYTFTGDVYGKTLVPVYMKDGLDNQNVEFISISNLDNTSPTIENIELNKTLHNTEIIISANDINEKLNASGSGVTGYAISKENNIPSEFQEENTFNLTKAGTYYLFITDLVGNITSKELNIPVQYKVTIDPDGGTWKGDSNPKEYITDEPINLYPEPEKEGYTFKEWEITGDGELDEEGNLIINGDVTITPIWEANKYQVTFIDYDTAHNRIMDTTTRELDFNSQISGSYIGNDITDNIYYPQYRLVSDTSVIISTNPENNVVYRYFEFCYTEKESYINFNDDNNKDGLRPEKYKLQLTLEDGQLIDEVTLPTSQPDYTFENLPKYDEQGEEYQYKIVPIISDRYEILPNPEDESTPEITYSSPACSINIPKTTTLDGRNGNLNYTIQVEANLFYKDKIIITPDTSVTLTDGVENLQATITQNKTKFNKKDDLQVTGKIQVTKKHFAGVWTGTFNFKIKYEVKN